MRHTRGHTGNRRSHHALKQTNVVLEGGVATRLPHRLDEATGMYRGKQIAPARTVKIAKGAKGPSTAPAASEHHDHEHAHENAELKAVKGGEKKATGARPAKAK